jgi:hypothetical protein
MEAIPVIIVMVVATALWIYAVVQKHFAAPDPKGEVEILHRRAAWLQERLDAARRENWDLDMISPILEDLTATRHQLARVEVRRFPG